MKNANGDSQNASVTYTISDRDNKTIATESKATRIGDKGSVSFLKSIPDVQKWSAEEPNLYSLVIELKDGNGKVIEATAIKIGFRTAEVKNKQFLVNGKPVLVKGVNVTKPVNIQAITSEELMRRDFELFRKYNVNTARTSHYPQRTVSSLPMSTAFT